MALLGRHTISARLPVLIVLVVFAVMAINGLWGVPANADKITHRELELSNNVPSATGVDYTLSFDIVTAATVGSIRMQLCENDPFIDTACTAPPGLDVSSAALSNQTGEIGFTKSNLSTSNVMILTRSPQAAAIGNVSYTLSGVTNPNVSETLYARIQTYASTDATGTNVDYGALAWEIQGALSIGTVVPPYLEFCAGVTIPAFTCGSASGDYLNLGELSSSATKTATSQLLAATNAGGGYTIRISGNTLTSNNNIIQPMTGIASIIGSSQFGINLRQNVNPLVGEEPSGSNGAIPSAGYNTPDIYRFASGEVIAAAPSVADYTKLTASYVVNIAKNQPAGVYVSTITYICLANF